MGVRRSQHDGMHHSGQRIVIEVRRVSRYETLVFTAFGSIANLPAGHWWLSPSFPRGPVADVTRCKTLLSEGPGAMICSSTKRVEQTARHRAEIGKQGGFASRTVTMKHRQRAVYPQQG